jgi:5'-methylthioadenosine phosphorylase
MSAGPHPASAAARATIVLGVVGGSGLYAMDGLADVEHVELDTPFGAPSDRYTVGLLPRPHAPPVRAVFLPRHGVGHRLLPGEVNYRANIHGFKQLGVTHLLSVSAVGSLQAALAPGHVALPNQLIDRTHGRAGSFFGDGLVAHVQFGHPVDPGLHALALAAAQEQAPAGTVHPAATLVVMEGPAFSTLAESQLHRAWGADLIGMTALPEAKLAREAELAYAIVAMVTDYDCWHDEEVSVDAVIAVLQRNAELARAIIRGVAARLPQATAELPYPHALTNALITARDQIPATTRARLDLIAGHLL